MENMSVLISISSKGVEADAIYDGKTVRVLAGSVIRPEFSEHVRGGKTALAYRNNRTFVDERGEVIRDCIFNSPSTAAQFVTGRCCNGYLTWKVEPKMTLDKYLISKGMRQKGTIKQDADEQIFKYAVLMNNRKWIFHLTDEDPFPSVLHGHCEEEKLKLDGFNGKIHHEKDKTSFDNLTKKELKKLHSNPKFQRFARRRLEYYNQKFPGKKKEIPVWAQSSKCMEKADNSEDFEFVECR